MLQPADVLKIKCKFVEKMVSFLNKRKYEIDACYCDVLPYFADAQLATVFADAECLDHDDECLLNKKAAKYSDQPELNPGIVSCSDQVDITLTQSSASCSTSTVVKNSTGQAYPKIVLYNDELYHDAVLNIELTDCDGTTQVEQIRCGCTGTPEVCTDANRVSGLMTFTLTTPATTYPGGYINTIRLYETDSNGVLINSPMDLDISPSNVGTWNACGTCTTVNAADLYFSSGNYATAWVNLMENISKTLYAGDVNLDASIITGSSLWLYQYRIKHNPSSEWLGPNRNDFFVKIYNGTTLVNPSAALLPFTQGSFLHQEIDFDVDCGTITATADSFAGGGATAGPLANFNYLQFLTQDIPLPISVSSSGDTSCTLVTLTAVYDTDQTVSSVEWLDPLLSTISTTTTAKVNSDDTGEYTFQVTLENGCVVSDTITV